MLRKKKKVFEDNLKDNQLVLPTGSVISFNVEQYEAINKIRKWLKGDKPIFTLAGYAGTGKTTCVKKILDEFVGDIIVSGPTHKSKKVIMNTTDIPGKTLHSLLGLRPDVDLDNFNPNDPQFNPIAEPTIVDYDLVVIDEASMINQDLYNMILAITEDYKIKILFIGDPAQIPPVGEKESAVFNETTNEFHQLTIIERQNESNPISAVYSTLRNNLNKESGGFVRKSMMNQQGEGIIFTEDKDLFKKLILEKYRSEEFKRDTDYTKVIAWRNKTVMGANKSIRNDLFGKDSDIIEIGDILMGYRSVRSSNARYNIIENSEDYRVTDKMDLSVNKYGIKGYQVRLREDLAHGKFKFKDVFIVDANDYDNLHQYAKLHDEYKEIGLNRKEFGSWTKYYDFRRNNILMKTIRTFKTGMVRNKKETIVKDMDYGMAITAHKCLSENSQIQRNDGFIPLKDIRVGDTVCVGNNQYEKVIDKINVGKKKSYKLRTSFGYEIFCSEDHLILNIERDFQPLKNFNVGDYIPINRNNIRETINIQERDINYYMGLLVADGWYSGSNKRDKFRILLTIGLQDSDNIKFIQSFYKENGINFGEYSYKDRKIKNFGVSNKEWRKKLLELGLGYVKGDEKSIPNSVLSGTLQEKSNFISGLFDGDGSVDKRGLVRFVNNSLLLIKDVQILLLEFGIISYYYKTKKAYTLSILGTSMVNYKKYISFRLQRKIDILFNHNYTSKTNKDIIPFRDKILDIFKKDIQNKSIYHVKNNGIFLKEHRKYSFFMRYKFLSYDNLQNIIKLYKINNKTVNSFIYQTYANHYFYDKIIEIKEIGKEQMFDLEINNVHKFIADGFIVHNSQGSTYSHVFVMENDIDENWTVKERNQLKYTSLTRPTTSAVVLINPENNENN
jgi:intein/homing endonuclease